MLGQGRVALVTQVSSAEVRVGPPGRGGSESVLSEGLSQSPGGGGEFQTERLRRAEALQGGCFWLVGGRARRLGGC